MPLFNFDIIMYNDKNTGHVTNLINHILYNFLLIIKLN